TQVAPQVQEADEVRLLVLEAGVLLVGLRALLERAHARVLDRERRRDDDDLVRAAEAIGLEDHPREARVDGKLSEPATQRREAVAGRRRRVERAELVQERDAVADLAAVGRVEEREVLDLTEPER